MNIFKKNKKLFYLIIQIIFLFLVPTIIFFVGIFKLDKIYQIWFSIVYGIIISTLAIVCAFLFQKYLQNSIVVKDSLNYYLENEVSKYGMGMIVFLNDGKIIWISKFIESRFSRKIVGWNIKDVFGIKEWNINSFDFQFHQDNLDYEIHVSLERNIAIIKDISIQNSIIADFEKQQTIFGEISIDNINLYQTTLSEEEIFKIYSYVANLLEDLSKKYDLIYRQYENGRFFVIASRETLAEFEKIRFDFFNKFRRKTIVKNISITISSGFSYGVYKFNILDQMAKEALLQSQTRGGDQTTIVTKNQKPRHYGSVSEIATNLSRTNTNYISRELINKLESKYIKKVIIYGHKNADLDALGSAYAIAKLAESYKKEVYIQNVTFDATTRRIYSQYKLNASKTIKFITPAQATLLNDSLTLVVIVDTSDDTRIENKFAFKNVKKENIMVLDHHRIAKNPNYVEKENSYIDSSASSASEIVTEIIALTNNSDRMDRISAQLLLNGIYLDTNIFQKQTSSKTFYACSLLEKWGATIQDAVNSLKMDNDVFEKVTMLLSNLQEVKPGYYLAYNDSEVQIDIISMAADEILRVQGRKAAFVVAKIPGTRRYKMSARGIDTNVQIIAEAVNGGGHFSAAAAESNEDLSVFIDNIKQAIVSVRNESNIN
ncbi:DHH family phosphoesterase [Metamycoplasma buccale]|uniref:DHH family phosphoesterase n=1 Tax=Metamycoplasma buccale TaxID=55602 RepID=UPI00398F020C